MGGQVNRKKNEKLNFQWVLKVKKTKWKTWIMILIDKIKGVVEYERQTSGMENFKWRFLLEFYENFKYKMFHKRNKVIFFNKIS